MLLQIDLQLLLDGFLVLHLAQLDPLLLDSGQLDAGLLDHLLRPLHYHLLLLHLHLSVLLYYLLELLSQVPYRLRLQLVLHPYSLHRVRCP